MSQNDTDSVFRKNVLISRYLMFFFLLGFLIFFVFFIFFYSISDFLVILGLSMFFIGPIYIANAMMVFTSDGRPLDGGRNFIDGKRLFGRTKTRGGFIGGFISGFIFTLIFGYIFYFIYPSIEVFAQSQEEYLFLVKISYLSDFFYPLPLMILIRAFTSGLSAPLGDLIGSFLKRRFSVGSGKPFWIVDQLDFILISLLLNFYLFPLNIYNILLLLLLSPSIALIANNVAYSFGKKKEPW
ncbi:MAG: CDP-archaeol synthase [Promethearchaeota archaeon]